MTICWRCVISLRYFKVKSRLFLLDQENDDLDPYFRQFFISFTKLKIDLKIGFLKTIELSKVF